MNTNKAIKMRIRQTVKSVVIKHRILAKAAAEILFIKLWYLKNNQDNDCAEKIQMFVPAEKRSIPKYVRRVMKDMIFSHIYYRIGNKEYFLYHFEDLTDSGRRKYIGCYELLDYFHLLNATGRPDSINNKELAYYSFKDFFRRDVLVVRDQSQKEDFISFVKRHPTCFLKPLNTYGGKGIKLLQTIDGISPEALYENFIKFKPFILEEQINQDPGMSAFYPQCVNTIRYTTFFYNGELTRLQAVLRMGRGGSIVDNATSGGIYALVDTETGVLLGPAHSFNGEVFKYHPDTGIQFVGSRVPRWSELNELLEKIVRVIPEQKQVGWDFALTPEGWVMVEANTGPAIQSFDPEHPMRYRICDVFGKAIPVNRY